MKIELKKIDVHATLSEETACYTADVYVDGVLFAHASNRGHGACDDFHPPKGKSWNDPEWKAQYDAIEAYLKANDPEAETITRADGSTFEHHETLETFCQGKAFEEIEKKNMRSRLSRTVMMIQDGKCYSIKGRKSPQKIEAVKKQYPDATILNEMPFADAFPLIMQHSA